MAKNSLLKSFVYAFQGLNYAWTERNFKLHIVSMCIAIGFGIYFSISLIEWTAIVICIGGVLALETMNTAIENLVDKISPEQNELAGRIKDLSAAAVLIFSIAALIVGLIVFLPYILLLF